MHLVVTKWKLIVFAAVLSLAALLYTQLSPYRFDFSQVPRSEATDAFSVLLLHNGGLGEQELCRRIQLVGQDLGWQVYAHNARQTRLQRLLGVGASTAVIRMLEPSFVLSLQPPTHPPDTGAIPHYLALQGALDEALIKKLKGDYAGFLLTSDEAGGLDLLKQRFGQDLRWMPWFPTCQAARFAPALPKRAFYCGANWDRTRKGEKFQAFYRALDQEELLNVYGWSHKWKHLSKSYRGYIESDGNSFLERMHESGIALVLHSDSHLAAGAPSARIFEAAAAGCLVISDRLSFIEREFEGSVFFIDVSASSEEMARQVRGHVEWARHNPEAAQAMIAQMQARFNARYTLEEQLSALKAFAEA